MDAKKYRTLLPRFFAILIDSLILLFLFYLESFLTVAEMPVSIVIVGITLYYFCNHFYFIYLHAAYGQTLGKMIMKIKVSDIDGNPISFKQAFLREFPFLTFSFILLISEIYEILSFGITENFRNNYFNDTILILSTIWLIAEFVVALSNDKRRAIHDYIAGTVIVRNKAE